MTDTRLGERRDQGPLLEEAWGGDGSGRGGDGSSRSGGGGRGGADGPDAPTPNRYEQRAGLARLALLVLALAALLVLFPLQTLFVLALIVIVLLHELGHFVTAKKAGMKVSEYFVGFGPRLWSTRRGETEYGVKGIPAGGYVKILGMTNLEEVDAADEARTYRQQSFPRRLSVAVAGSAVHFALALLMLWGLYAFAGTPDTTRAQVAGFGAVGSQPSPARSAGFRPGDVIVSVDGQHITPDSLPSYIHGRAGHSLTFLVRRGSRTVSLVATPGNAARNGKPEGMIGVELTSPLVTVNPAVATGRSVKDLGTLSWGTVKALGGLFSPNGLDSYLNQVIGHSSSGASSGSGRFVSVVGVVHLASQAARTGIPEVLNLLILINVFIGLFNLLPMLPLDGGHVAIAVYERIRSRRGRRYYADAAKLMPVAAAFFFLIVLLGVTALYLDLVHPLANPFR